MHLAKGVISEETAELSSRVSTGKDPVRGAITIDTLSVCFERKGITHLALSGIDVRIAPGEFVSVLGPSGCGKSTLLNTIGGMVRPTAGGVQIDGVTVAEPTAVCGVVFQQHSLFPWMTALDNVAFGPRMLQQPSPREAAREFLSMVGLEKFANAYPAQLSGGMQQRVGIARALAIRPPVLLMDEPFGALDAQTRSVMQEELLKIWSGFKTTVVFITHDIGEAIFLSDRILVMSNAPGSIREDLRVVLARPRTPEATTTPAFGVLHQRITRLIREESAKVFSPTLD